MAENSKIEWTDHTANLWHGCAKVHAGCDHCYAETLSHRWGNDIWGNDKPRKIVNSVFSDLDKFQKAAAKEGAIKRVFVGSMMDIFEKPMPLIDSKGKTTDNDTGMLRSTFFGNITKGMYNNLLFQMLTKRPSNIKRYIPVSWQMPLVGSPPNVMFGTSISDQETAKTLYPQLMTAPGRKFLSVEPQIGPIRLFQLFEEYGKVDQVIQGGESGHHRRPFDLDWAYQMKEDCREYGIPYFFKQIDKVREIPEDLMVREFPEYNLVAGADFRD